VIAVLPIATALLFLLVGPVDARDRWRLVGPSCRLRATVTPVRDACPEIATWSVRGRCHRKRLRARLTEEATTRMYGQARYGRQQGCAWAGTVSGGQLVATLTCPDGTVDLSLQVKRLRAVPASCPSTTTTTTTLPRFTGCDTLAGCAVDCFSTPCGRLQGQFWPGGTLTPVYLVALLTCGEASDFFTVPVPPDGRNGLGPVIEGCTGTLFVRPGCPSGTLTCPRCCPAGMTLP
jgi:hypothetical protein